MTALAAALIWDIRYSIRMFRKNPGFTVVAVLALAFGIGVNSAIFTLLNAIALRPLPVKNASEVVTVYQTMSGLKSRNVHGAKSYLSYPEFSAYRDQSHVFSGLTAYAVAQLTLGGPGARSLIGQVATCNYFSTLTGPLPMGRGFLPEECAAPGAGPVVVLSHAFWQRQFAGDPGVLGKALVLNRNTFTIVGVAPEGFAGASMLGADVWAPISAQEQWIQGRDYLTNANLSWLEAAGRLKPGTSLAQARADLAVIAARADLQYPGRRTTLLVDKATLMNNPEGRTPVLAVGAVVLVAVSLVLLIACANLANFLLARAAIRKREIAVRLAVGASRGRLIGQLLTESVMLALAGGVLGVATAWWTLASVLPAVIGRMPEEVQAVSFNLSPDVRILLYSLGLAFATGIGFGLIPALQSSKVDLSTALKEGVGGGRSRGRLRSVLLAAQVSVCLVLLIAAGLLARGLHSAQSIDPGFRMKDIAVAGFDLKREGYTDARAAVFNRQLAARLAAQPGVEQVGFAIPVPLSANRHGSGVVLEGQTANHTVNNAHVSANYFEMLDIPIVRGRAFEEREMRAGAYVVIVSESTARRLWPGADPVGRHLRFGEDKAYSEVVGVAKDIHASSLSKADDTFVYLPVDPTSQLGLNVLVRGKVGFAAIAKSIASETRALDANVLTKAVRFEDHLEIWKLGSRITSTLALALGLVGLLLASVGIYGVMAYAVAQRTKEIGIRMTLGAQRKDVLRLILAQSMRPVGIGVGLGLAGCAAVSGVLSSLLYGVSPLDPLVFGGVACFLASVALLAGWAPARRATRVDPMSALRHE
jgi:macrolide transport system ATP-binding/permease protein